MFRRIVTSIMAAVLVASLATQTVPHALAITAPTHDCCPMEMGDADPGADVSDIAMAPDEAGVPCKGLTPACIDVMGCVVPVAVPLQEPVLTRLALAWSEVAYTTATRRLAGRSVPPDPFPPNALD
jgi:hypothetical protein